MIMPIQRIPRYVLLIKEIMRNLYSSEDNSIWSSVYEHVEHVCGQINRSNGSREQFMSILKVQLKLSGLEFSLVAPHRKMIKEIKAVRIGASARSVDRLKIRAYLFNDILIWTNRQYRFKGFVELAGCKLLSILPGDIYSAQSADDVRMFDGESVKSQFGFHILDKKSSIPLTIIFASKSIKEEWEKLIMSLIDATNRTAVSTNTDDD